MFTAQSQDMKSMGKDAFRESKNAVLDLLASYVGVAVPQMKLEAGRAA